MAFWERTLLHTAPVLTGISHNVRTVVGGGREDRDWEVKDEDGDGGKGAGNGGACEMEMRNGEERRKGRHKEKKKWCR